MNFSERQQIIDFLNEFEKNFPTERWEYEEVKVWPILKTSLFLSLFWRGMRKAKMVRRKSGLLQSLKPTIKKRINAFKFQKMKMKPADFLFFSGVNFRETFDGKSFNKFYDPIADFLVERNRSFLFLEYGSQLNQKTYKDRGLNIQMIYNYFEATAQKTKPDYEQWQGMKELIVFFESKFSDASHSLYSEIELNLRKVIIWKSSFDWVLEQIKPDKVFLLSYYNIPCFGLLAAAKKKGITCVDIQHGLQGEFHPAYSGFKEDYALLPDLFWLWDEHTANRLKANLPYHNLKTLTGGNPWHSALKNRASKSDFNQPCVLFTLQPVSPPVDEYIFEAIAQSKNEINWLIRLHPRIDAATKNQLIERLKALQVFDPILWQKANTTPLPLLLKEVDLHLSKFSGCISEAADLGTFSIILEKSGEISYSHLIESGAAIGGIDSNSEKLLSTIFASFGKNETKDAVDMEPVLEQLC